MRKFLTILILVTALFCLSGCSADSSPVSGSSGETGTSSLISEQNDGNSQSNSDVGTSSEIKSESSKPGSGPETGNNDPQTSSSVNASTETDVSDTESGSKILVAFFSRAGENYGVGYIEKGNTHIIADMIAEETNADTFEIVRVTPYPAAYRDCTDEAQREKNENARPGLTASVDNFDDYDVIFLGYPNWWGDMPMPVYTFLESYDFSGKTVIPFCTHAGSGLSGTVGTLRSKLSGATVLDGLAIPGTTAQNEQEKAKQSVAEWIGKLNLS